MGAEQDPVAEAPETIAAAVSDGRTVSSEDHDGVLQVETSDATPKVSIDTNEPATAQIVSDGDTTAPAAADVADGGEVIGATSLASLAPWQSRRHQPRVGDEHRECGCGEGAVEQVRQHDSAEHRREPGARGKVPAMTATTQAPHDAAAPRLRAVRLLATAALIAGWVFVAYLSVALSVQRLLPTASVDPWPLTNVIYAMVLIYLPAAAATGAWRMTRSGTWFRRGFVHVIAMLTVLVVLLLGSPG